MSSDSSDTSKVEGVDGGGGTEQSARRGLEEEFNVQRARMKELFLQKEEDHRQLVLEKEQLQSEVLGLRAELEQLQTLSQNQKSDVLSLQLVVDETLQESQRSEQAARAAQARCAELEQQLAQLRRDQPVEEGELLRYETELAALKNKLRDTDSQLQEALKSKTTNVTSSSSSGDTRPDPEGARACDMCANYEKQLVLEQREAAAARERRDVLEQALRLATTELEGARSIHEETIQKWHAERAASSASLSELRAAVDAARATLADTADAAQRASQRALEHVTTLTVEREELQRKLDSLECDNATLIGRFTKKAEELQSEFINLPDSVDELQLTLLELHEKLICVQIGREDALAAERDLRAQLQEHSARAHRAQAELAAARAQQQQAREELERLTTEREQLQELGGKLRQSNDTIHSLLEDKKRILNELAELRGRVSALQQELDNSEKVQQDFVRLSQSLQVQLQRIREADTEVRWQHDEDVTSCPSCHVALPTPKKKVHCRHCGRIFCAACAAHAVPSGPRRLPARVCAVCRTLLQPHTAPYFSTAPPHTPD